MYVHTAPREKRYHSKYKKVLYLEPPTNGSKTVRTRVTTIVPPASPPEPPVEMLPEPIHLPMPTPAPEPPVMVMPPPPPPPPQHYYHPMPPYPVSEAGDDDDDEPIDVIAVDVDPPRARSSKSSKSSSSSSSSSNSSSRSSRSSRSSQTSRSHNSHRHGHSCEREVYVERERFVPVHVPYPVHEEKNDYDTFRYVEAPRRFEPRRRSTDDSDERQIIIEDHRQRRYIRD
ncbi:hypothetical protein MGN70_009555 [Eutypa lata]|nr:hypothetical protein MGN70_009555 [Eutypa lata]